MTGSPVASPVSLPPIACAWRRRSAAIDAGDSAGPSRLLEGWLQLQANPGKNRPQQAHHKYNQQTHKPILRFSAASHATPPERGWLHSYEATTVQAAGAATLATASETPGLSPVGPQPASLLAVEAAAAGAPAAAANSPQSNKGVSMEGSAASLRFDVGKKLAMFRAAVQIRKKRQEFDRRRRQSLIALIQHAQQPQAQEQQQQERRAPEQMAGQHGQQQQQAAAAQTAGNLGPLWTVGCYLQQQQLQQSKQRKRDGESTTSKIAKSYLWQWGGKPATAASATANCDGVAANVACATRGRRSIYRRVSVEGHQNNNSPSSRRKDFGVGLGRRRSLLSHVASLQRKQLLGPQRLRLLRRQLEVVQLLGEGASGSVWKVRQKSSGKIFALKVIKKESPKEDPRIACARRYAERYVLMHGDMSRHLVGLHAAFQDKHSLFLLQDFAAGHTLRELMQQRGPLEEEEVREYALQLAEALHAIHRLGFLHRDVKPENIIIDSSKQLRLTDMGLALAAIPAGPLHALQQQRCTLSAAAPVGGPLTSPQPRFGGSCSFEATQIGPLQDNPTICSSCPLHAEAMPTPELSCSSGREEAPSLREAGACCCLGAPGGPPSLASWRLQQLSSTEDISSAGTLHYMAPEVALGAQQRHAKPVCQQGLPSGPQLELQQRQQGGPQCSPQTSQATPNEEAPAPKRPPKSLQESFPQGGPEGAPRVSSEGPTFGSAEDRLIDAETDVGDSVKADWWSYGAVVYECLFGFPPLGRFYLRRKNPAAHCNKSRQPHSMQAGQSSTAPVAAAPTAAGTADTEAEEAAPDANRIAEVEATEVAEAATATAAGTSISTVGEVVNNPELVLCMLKRFEDFIALPPEPFVVSSSRREQQHGDCQRSERQQQQRATSPHQKQRQPQEQQQHQQQQQQQLPVVSLEAIEFLRNLLCAAERRFVYRDITRHPWICRHNSSAPRYTSSNGSSNSNTSSNSESRACLVVCYKDLKPQDRLSVTPKETIVSLETTKIDMALKESLTGKVSPRKDRKTACGECEPSAVSSSYSVSPAAPAAPPSSSAALPSAAACSWGGGNWGPQDSPFSMQGKQQSSTAWETDFRFLGFDFNAQQRRAAAAQQQLRAALQGSSGAAAPVSD